MDITERLISSCCSTKVYMSRGDGVMIGSCAHCGAYIVRLNPETGVEEWLDGKSPWTKDDCRPTGRTKPRG